MLVSADQSRVMFTGVGTAATYAHQTSAIIVQVGSHRIKNLLNSIIPKQGAYVLEYCLKQTMKDLRASTFKKPSYQMWNVESILSLRNWLQCEKEFTTGATGLWYLGLYLLFILHL